MATKGSTLELEAYKIRVNTLSPAVVRTKTLEQFGQDLLDRTASQMPVALLCEVDVVNVVLFLLSDKSHMITGSDVVID